ncbi:M16 family metallopeptidase [Granulicella mallensis]|uniref:Processing peptidase n=1 Tax=Granulicella mallensis (strain ATCC BAA-1857 / DSM 23137 / MP5ACTX8) TaxID=682795 RepID=G8NQD3_GRAMM|nr:pitrilysin family protein [Granulicella mallensis]AEU36082.1 processing peptidase [Granulicella mallensis MP5ACTX8]
MPVSVPVAENATFTTAPTHTRDIRKTTLPNGLLVLTERMPHFRSVSMGVWIDSGSRDEAPEVNGIAHFIEHMVFKGTTTRSAQQLAREVDSIGGNLDAFTGKETVCFNIKVLDENVPAALDLLTDLVLHPTFAPDDLAREQGVILEEIKMDEDNPDYLVHELFTQNFWKNDALGRPILGTAKTVSSFTQQIVFNEYARLFTPPNMVFSAAGNLDHDDFVAQVAQAFGSLSASSGSKLVRPAAPQAFPHITLKNKKSLEQVQFCLAMPSLEVSHPDRFTVHLLNSILGGGGMSSRLFQSIREERGLAYSIYSETNPFRDTGSLAVYAGCAIDKTREVLDLTLAEFSRMKHELVSEEELKRVKDQSKGNMVLGLESSSSRMSNLARQQMYYGEFFSVEDLTAEVDRVSREDIQRLAQQLFQPENFALTLLGNLGGLKIERADLTC